MTYLLEGSVRRSGSKVRISAEVVNASSGARIWKQTYEREVADVFAIQDEIARAVVQAVAPVLFAGSVSLPTLNSQGTEASQRQEVDTLERSAVIDPRYAPTQALLAFACFNLASTRTVQADERARVRTAARDAANRAVELDRESSWGYAPRAFQRLADLDWEGAAADLDRAIALDPASPFVLNARAIHLNALGKPLEALEVMRRAVEQDPLDAIHTGNLASSYLANGRYAEGKEWSRRAEELSRGMKPYMLEGWVSLHTGDAAQALIEFERVGGPGSLAGASRAKHQGLWPLRGSQCLRPLHSSPRFPALLRRLGSPEEERSGKPPVP